MNLTSKLLLASASIAALAFPGVTFAQSAPASAPAATEVEEVVVIGTRRTDRTLTDSASPVDVISAADLNLFRFVETAEEAWGVLEAEYGFELRDEDKAVGLADF